MEDNKIEYIFLALTDYYYQDVKESGLNIYLQSKDLSFIR